MAVDLPISGVVSYSLAWGVGFATWPTIRDADLSYEATLRLQDAVYYLVGAVVDWLYFACLESSPLQGTFGKKAFSLFLINEAGARLSFAQATWRYFGKYLSAAPLGFGFLCVFWSAGRRAFHDRLAGAVVMQGSLEAGIGTVYGEVA